MCVPWCSSWKKACWPLIPVSAPNNRGSFVTDRFTVKGHLFAVALHIELLNEFRQAVEMLVVRCDNVAAAAVVIDVPDADEGEDDGHVAL